MAKRKNVKSRPVKAELRHARSSQDLHTNAPHPLRRRHGPKGLTTDQLRLRTEALASAERRTPQGAPSRGMLIGTVAIEIVLKNPKISQADKLAVRNSLRVPVIDWDLEESQQFMVDGGEVTELDYGPAQRQSFTQMTPNQQDMTSKNFLTDAKSGELNSRNNPFQTKAARKKGLFDVVSLAGSKRHFQATACDDDENVEPGAKTIKRQTPGVRS